MRQCSRCASELNEKDKVCPRCGLPIEKMQESEETLSEKMMKESKSEKLNKAQKKEKLAQQILVSLLLILLVMKN